MGFTRITISCLFAMAMLGAQASESIAITARPRYPWNGKVDLRFTIDGTSGTKYDTSFTAKDVAGGTNLTMKTLYKSDGTAANVAKEQLLPGTYNWVWNATADLGEGTVLEKVVVEGKTENNEADAKRYMVVDLTSGKVSYMASAPSEGWADNPYRQTKWAFQRIEPGEFNQSSGEDSVRKVTITHPYYVSLTALTSYQCNKIGGFDTSGVFDYKKSPSATYDYKWPLSVTTVIGCDGGAIDGSGSAILYRTNSRNDQLLPAFRAKTGLAFSFPTEAQLTLARKTMDIGTTWIFTRDYWWSDLGNKAVTDPCSVQTGSTRTATACVTMSGRSFTRMVAELGADGDQMGHYVCIRLCLEVE